MKVAPVADVKARLSAYLERIAAEGPIVITRNGHAVAVLLAPENDDDLEQILLSRSPRFQALLNRSRKSIREGKGLSHSEFWEAAERKNAHPAKTRQLKGPGKRRPRS
jgi:prevent-host-death family protein